MKQFFPLHICVLTYLFWNGTNFGAVYFSNWLDTLIVLLFAFQKGPLGSILPTSSSVPVALCSDPSVVAPSTSCTANVGGPECTSTLLSCSPCSSESASASLTPLISAINSPVVSAPTNISRPGSSASAQTPYVHVIWLVHISFSRDQSYIVAIHPFVFVS